MGWLVMGLYVLDLSQGAVSISWCCLRLLGSEPLSSVAVV